MSKLAHSSYLMDVIEMAPSCRCFYVAAFNEYEAVQLDHEAGDPTGRGRSKAEAIQNLVEQIQDRDYA
jgi:hypothetical protein